MNTSLAVEEFLIEDFERACLDEIMTVSEAMHTYHKSHKTIVDLVKSGQLVGRQARHGRTWLLSKSSLDFRWGGVK